MAQLLCLSLNGQMLLAREKNHWIIFQCGVWWEALYEHQLKRCPLNNIWESGRGKCTFVSMFIRCWFFAYLKWVRWDKQQVADFFSPPTPFQSDVRMWCRRRRPGKEGAVACHWFLSNNKYLHICFSSDSGKAAIPQSAHVLFSTALLLQPYCLHFSSWHRAGSYSNVLIIQMWLWMKKK